MVTKGDLPQDIRTFISQLRKRHLILLTTVQEWLDTNISFRRYVKFSTSCSMRNIFGRAFSRNVTVSGYDMHWDNLQNEYVAPVLWTSFRKCSKQIADSYDTDEVIAISKKSSRQLTPMLADIRGLEKCEQSSHNHIKCT